jgi:hypothetical protein
MSDGAIPPLTLAEVQSAVTEALSLGHFFVSPGVLLRSVHVAHKEIPWEIFRGRLLDPAHTRRRQTFESWGIEPAQEPACHLSVKLAFDAGSLHVTRGILCRVWEGYDSGNNVIESREISRCVEELIGTIDLDQVADVSELRKDLAWLIFRAVVGLSKLPLSSIEAPLPGFSLGTFAYFPGPTISSEPLQDVNDLLQRKLRPDQEWLAKAKLLEFALRATPKEDIQGMTSVFGRRWQETDHATSQIPALVRTLFNEVALSPYTDFVDKFLTFLECLTSHGVLRAEEQIDLLGHLLRQTARHLTAYDLVTFHHRGANYPDALFLHAVLREFLSVAERQAVLLAGDDLAGRLRRRALRQGWLLRKLCEGLPVPESPTSPGENARILPGPFQRIPDQEIDSPGRRSKRLFADLPLPALRDRTLSLLMQSLTDLRHPHEMRELGIGLFLDRPLGRGKAVGEPDLTTLLSYQAFSATIASKRLGLLKAEFPDFDWQTVTWTPEVGRGLRIHPSGRPPRPASVSLDDCFRAADDFVLLASTRSSVRAFLESFDFMLLSNRFPIEFLAPERELMIVSADSVADSSPGALRVYDEEKRLRLVLRFDGSHGYRRRIDREVPAAGLAVTYACTFDQAGERVEHDLEKDAIVLPPRM